jgi:hypothetical protein
MLQPRFYGWKRGAALFEPPPRHERHTIRKGARQLVQEAIFVLRLQNDMRLACTYAPAPSTEGLRRTC